MQASKQSSKKGLTLIDSRYAQPCPYYCNHRDCKSSDRGEHLYLPNHFFVWIYGGPASGKTTQVDMICNKFGMIRLNAGDLIKAKMQEGSMRAKCLRDAMERGELVPNDYVIDLLKEDITSKAQKHRGFVIDGYPREEEQGNLFEEMIAPPDVFIFLDMEKSTLLKRQAARAIAALPKWQLAMKNFKYQTGKLQMHIFFTHHTNILKMYRKKIIRVSGENKSPEKIFSEIEKIIKKAIARKKSEIIAREVKSRITSVKSINKLQDSKSTTGGQT